MKRNLFLAIAILIVTLSVEALQPRNEAEATKALRNAVIKSEVNKVKSLVAQFPRIINMQDEFGNTALIFASADGNAETIDLLLKANADLNTQDKDGNTALVIAVANRKEANVKKLLDAGADITIKNNEGKTALSLALENAGPDFVDLWKPETKAAVVSIAELLKQASNKTGKQNNNKRRLVKKVHYF